jgi:signal transduction histidine kinase
VSGARVQAPPALPAVLGHPATLGSALSNLVGNALKFVAPGQAPEVRIASERRSDLVVLCVEDNGIGVPREEQERIFLPFTRLHGQETYPGTGIGLAVVRRSVERMGGSVHLHSIDGAGSRFELHLKAA